MKECKQCFFQIEDRASVCRHCQSSQRMIPNEAYSIYDIKITKVSNQSS